MKSGYRYLWLWMGLAVLLAPTTATSVPVGKHWRWIDGARVQGMLQEGSSLWLIDVRSASAYESGHIEGSVNIPSNALQYKRFPVKRTLVLVDEALGQKLAREAAEILAEKGHERVYVLEGGIVSWSSEGLPVIEGSSSIRGVTAGELKWALAKAVPLILIDMRDENDRKRGLIRSSESVRGKTIDERVEKLRKLLIKRKRKKKNLLSKMKRPQPVVLVFSASEDAATYTRIVRRDVPGDIRYLIGGYEAFVSEKIRGVRVSGACPTCQGK